MKIAAAAATLCCLSVAVAGAEVRLTTLPDGSRLMSNDGPARAASALRVSRPELDLLIDAHARSQRLEPELVRSMVRVESGYNPLALSRKGAMGLMQLMPETARALGVTDPYDPDQNLRGGTAYLRRLLDRFRGDLTLALAGYNAGPEAVERYRGLPPYAETRNYVTRVLSLFRGEAPPAIASRLPGRRTYLIRDARGRLVMTTTPPASR